jgi:RHS repeat-associated protein
MQAFKQTFCALLLGGILFLPSLGHCGGVVSTNTESALNTALSGGGTVTFSFDGTIVITSRKTISADTTIDGSGHSITISGGNSVGIFNVNVNHSLTLSNLTLSDGNGVVFGSTRSGGAILNLGTLAAWTCMFSNNAAVGATGTTGVAGADGSGSSNGSDAGAGGAGQQGSGGAVYGSSGSTSSFNSCSFFLNDAVGGNGGVGGKGGNAGPNGFNGGKGGNGGNGAYGLGGAIFNESNSGVAVTNCTFAYNSSLGGNGGAGGSNGSGPSYSPPGGGGSGGPGQGGAVFSQGAVTIMSSTFYGNAGQGGDTQTAGVNSPYTTGNTGNPGGNSYGGAVFNSSTNTILNCTFSANKVTGGKGGNGGPSNGNTGGNGGIGGSGFGGNIYNNNRIGLTNVTIASGAAFGGAKGLGDTTSPFHGSDGANGSGFGANIGNGSGNTFNLKNSLLDSPTNAPNAYSGGAITDRGNNLSSDTTPNLGSGHTNVTIHLDVLRNNGGPTATLALLSNSPAINAGDDVAAPFQDQRGYLRPNVSDIGAFEYGGIPLPVVQLYALGPDASGDGDQGLFFIEQISVTTLPYPLTVNYTITGTASNGVHYVQITNSVTIPANGFFAEALVQAVPGSFSGTNLSVVLALSTNAAYQIDTNQASGTVLLYPHNTFNSGMRYVRGSSTAPDFQSFVIPLNAQTGVPLAAIGGNATNLFPGNQWTNNLYHYNATNLVSQWGLTNGRIVFQNPIVCFGSPVGGSPLYLNQNYSFGIGAGDASANLSNALRIQVYSRSNSAYVGTISMPLPDVTQTSALTTLATNGFTQTFSGFGLQTTILVSPFENWGVIIGSTFNITHTATATATNYYFVVEEGAISPVDYLVLNASANPDYSRLYAMEFSPFPAGRSTFIDQPHFDTVPLPSQLQGKSLQELTNVAATLPDLSFLIASNYLTLNASPELKRHPILDQFVADMGNDPMALANYVINEIDLTDAIDYDINADSQPAVNLGGVDRGALATFQEGQGSPLEQCALLIYLLRQAGVPAAYVYPTNNGLQMLDYQMSKLLRVQLRGALSRVGQTNLPQMISVNYPWVAAYIGTNWVQIFPWLKDTEISEGFNLYDYMPTNYNSGFKWLTHFIANDTNIFSLSSSDQPMDLLPLFIQQNLTNNFPGVSVDDLGMQIINRRHLFAQWSDFPKPFALSGTPLVVESLSTNLNLFNTLDIRVFSLTNPSKFIDTTEMRTLDFHDRKLLLKFLQVGGTNAHDMILTLSPYSTNITSQTAFATNADPTWKLVATNRLNSTDDTIIFQVTHRRLRFLPGNYAAPLSVGITNLWGYSYFESGQQTGQSYVSTNTFRKGDLIAFCLDVGRVTQKMLNVQAQEIWQFNLTANTNNPTTLDPDIYEGTTAYLLGMSYFNYNDRFIDFNSRLHKIQQISSFQYGFGLIRPLRVAGTGALPSNGVVTPVTPAVHMPINGQAYLFNNTLRPDLGRDRLSSFLDFWLQGGVQSSAAEHGVLRSYYQTNAVSAVKLLQLSGTNVVKLNLDNYVAGGTVVYHGVQLQNADPALWSSVASFFASAGGDYDREVFITPGTITNGTYSGVAAILFSSSLFDSPISGLNGGYGYNLSDGTFASSNSVNVTVNPAPNGSVSPYLLQTAPVANNQNVLVNGTSAGSLPGTFNLLLNNQANMDPNYLLAGQVLPTWFGEAGSPAFTWAQVYNQGAASSEVAAYNDLTKRVLDPVDAMTGEFYVDATDISLPGPMPLQIRRNYGSQNLVENQFGFGWKISYVPFLGMNTNASLIFAAEMDGSMVAYRQTTTNANLWVPLPQDNPTLNNNSSLGVGSVANLFNNQIQLASGTNYTVTGADGSVRTFIQRSYPIGSFSRQRPYLDKWQDSRGNFYTFQYGTNSTQPDYGQVRRIQSSNGNFAGFYYDDFGHVIEAYTGDDRRLVYEYDHYGDLVTVTLPDEAQINYVYQHANSVTNSITNVYSTHLILQEVKPDGRMLQNAYDSQRRVTSQYSTVGADLNLIRSATFAYTNNFSLTSPTNLLTGRTDISDYTNRVTTYFYTNSLMRKVVDPLNQIVTQDWYEADTNSGYRRSLKSRTDKRGLQTVFQYDTFGNATNTTVTGDLTGDGGTINAVTSAFYNTNNLPLQIIDPAGNSLSYVYQTNFPFLPQQIIKYAGITVVSTNFLFYDSVTNVVTQGALPVTNLAFGVLRREIRAFGSADAATNEMFYDGRGFPTNVFQYTGTADPNVTNAFLYNNRGELAQRTDAAGRKFCFGYDPLGRLSSQEIYEAGQTSPVDWNYSYYDGNGELMWTDGARYNPEDYVWRDYDGAGRKIQEIHWRSRGKTDGSGVEAETGDDLYATTFYQYDPLGNLTQTTDPLGNYAIQNYDAIGQLTKRVFYGSNGVALATNGWAYEPGGQVAFSTNALGAVTANTYASTGKLKFRSNPDGSTNGWRYDLSGRLVTEYLANGNYWQTVYDDANRRVTKYFHNAGSILATNIVVANARGNIIQQTDSDGFLRTNFFDGLDRLKVAAGPAILSVVPAGLVPGTNYVTNVLQRLTYYVYDASGKTLTTSNALSEKTVTTSDALGRPTQVAIYAPNNATPVQVVSNFYSADHQSMTVTRGTGTNAIVSTIYTDNDGHAVLTLGYPTNGITEYVWQKYDRAGNRIAQQENSFGGSTVSTWATNGWTYDGLNRVFAEISRDGVAVTNNLDALGNVTNRMMPNGLTWVASYINDGRIANEQVGGGGITTRSNSYQYYAAGQPYAGLLQIVTDGRSTTRSNSYDDFLRLASVTTSGSAPEQQTAMTYLYDRRGLLTSLSQSFNTNSTGPSTQITRVVDGYGDTTSESLSLGGASFTVIGQSWDGAGRKTSLSLPVGRSIIFGYRADGAMTLANGSLFGYGSSFTYNDNGLLTIRSNSSRTLTVNQRDGRGRILQDTTAIGANKVLVENLSWRNDGRLNAYSALRSDFTNNCSYTYSSLARRLTQESFNVSASQRLTNSYTFDNGQAGRLGVLTSIGTPAQSTNNWSAPASGGLDGLSRVAQEQSAILRRPATGKALGAATVSATLDGNAVAVQFDGTAADGRWRANLDLPPGSHTLKLSALHPSGQFTAYATNTFTASGAADTLQDQYDGNGNINRRVWISSGGQTNRTQVLTWDAFNRLIKVTDRDSLTNGFDFVSVYDGLGRRLRTICTMVVSNTPLTSPADAVSTVDSWYDPQVEFLEVGVSVNGLNSVKTYGPDANGTYGGLNGVGGYETDTPVGQLPQCTAVQDYFGNVLACIENGVVNWRGTRLNSYGPVPGYQSPSLSPNNPLDQVTGWRGKRVDETGFIYLGARLYDPVAGRFLNADPLGHAASLDLYSYCGGDPVNGFDPDGRLVTRNTESGSENAPLPLEYGRVAVMQQSIFTDYCFTDGTHTGPTAPSQAIMYDADKLGGNRYWNKTEPTGQYYTYIRDSRDGGPLSDPAYGSGKTTWTPITTTDIEQRQRVNFLASLPTVILYMDGAGGLVEGVSARLLAADTLAAEGTAARQTTILGENMAQRTMPFADQTGARTLGFGATREEWAAMSPAERWQLNDGMLRARINEGDAFRYIGQDPLRNPALRTQFDLTGSELLRLESRNAPYQVVSPAEVQSVIKRP